MLFFLKVEVISFKLIIKFFFYNSNYKCHLVQVHLLPTYLCAFTFQAIVTPKRVFHSPYTHYMQYI